jgi:spore coat polysaccharide biosynthesis protein SpsF
MSNSSDKTYPRGLDAEIFSITALEQAFHEAHSPTEREHVTVFFYTHPERFRIKKLSYSLHLDQHRWTVDTPEDFALIKKILENLYPINPSFRLTDVLQLLEEHPDWGFINAHVKQKPLSSSN